MDWLLFTVLTAIATAVIATGNALRARKAASEACATCATLSGIVSEWEATMRSMPSRLADLAELRAAVDRAEDLLLKVNRREIARAKTRDESGAFTRANGFSTTKDELRARAGLRAGMPAPHS